MLMIVALVCKFTEEDTLVCYHFCEQECKRVTMGVRTAFLRSLTLMPIYPAAVGGAKYG